MTVRSTTALALLLAAVALSAVGCGGRDEQETSTATTAGPAQEQASNGATSGGGNAQNGAGGDGQGSDAGGAQPQGGSADTDGPQAGSKSAAPGVPTTKGGDNSIQTFGTESESEDRTQAAAALQAYLDARAAGEWARACSQLSSGAREQADGRIVKVRAEEERAFVVFAAPGAKLYQQTMVREGGRWKLTTVATSVLVPEL